MRSIISRIRLFIWKLVHGALPLGKVMFSQIGRGNPTCMVCGEADEDPMHLAFQCPFVRACWFASGLSLKSDVFNSDVIHSL